MGSHRRKGRAILDEESASEHALEEFGQTFLESLHPHLQDQQDPFEMYIESVRSHFHGHMPDFNHRLALGYHALLQALSRSNPK